MPTVQLAPPKPPVELAKAPEFTPAMAIQLWSSGSRLDAESAPWDDDGAWCRAALAYLAMGRGLDLDALGPLDVARILPTAEACPTVEGWPAERSRTYRVAVPLYAVGGQLVNVQGRAIVEAKPKTMNPTGGQVTGAFFADPGGLDVLRGATWAGRALVVVEGLTDYLSAAQLAAELEPSRRPAVLGIVAGSARALSVTKLATTCRLVVLTDNDTTGERYFEEVKRALPGLGGVRVKLPSLDGKRADLNDWLRKDRALATEALTGGVA